MPEKIWGGTIGKTVPGVVVGGADCGRFNGRAPALSEVEGAPAPHSHLLSPQQMPRFLIPRMLGRLQVRRQDDTTRALASHIDWNDVPDIFRDDVGGYEINFVLCIRLLPPCAEMAIVRFIHLSSSRFHMHPQDASALISPE